MKKRLGGGHGSGQVTATCRTQFEEPQSMLGWFTQDVRHEYQRNSYKVQRAYNNQDSGRIQIKIKSKKDHDNRLLCIPNQLMATH